MKKFFKLLGIILGIVLVIWELIEFLAFPTLLLIIGLLNDFPWQYYAISIGGYFLIFILIEVIAHFVFKALDKKYTPFFERKLEKIFNRLNNRHW